MEGRAACKHLNNAWGLLTVRPTGEEEEEERGGGGNNEQLNPACVLVDVTA